MHDISLEVANRAVIREQQKREIERLTQTLTNLRKHQAYVKEQISQYREYLQQCREQHYRPTSSKLRGNKKSKKEAQGKTMAGPFKFSYKDLQKQGVIVDSEVPALSRKKTQFLISSEEVGVFDIVAKIAGISVEKVRSTLSALLSIFCFSPGNSLKSDDARTGRPAGEALQRCRVPGTRAGYARRQHDHPLDQQVLPR